MLSYPRFDSQASEILLQTDASAVGLGAVLEQDGHVIAYASRSPASPEQQYSVIERECLAVVYALKQFRHYLLGRRFKLLSDHAPLQWLSAQEMEGMLCWWALAMQEYDFQITFRKGSQNSNADALSCLQTAPCAVMMVMLHYSTLALQVAQQENATISRVYHARLHSSIPPQGPGWNQYPLRQY